MVQRRERYTLQPTAGARDVLQDGRESTEGRLLEIPGTDAARLQRRSVCVCNNHRKRMHACFPQTFSRTFLNWYCARAGIPQERKAQHPGREMAEMVVCD